MAERATYSLGQDGTVGGILGPVFFNPYPRTGLVHPDQTRWPTKDKSAARQKFFKIVYVGPDIPDPFTIPAEELEMMLDPSTELGRGAIMYDEVYNAVKTLGSPAEADNHLKRVFIAGNADVVLEERVPRDWDGDPITAGIIFDITNQEAQATALKFGLQDGQPRTLDEVADIMGTTRQDAGWMILQAIRKFRQKQIGVFHSPRPSP